MTPPPRRPPAPRLAAASALVAAVTLAAVPVAPGTAAAASPATITFTGSTPSGSLGCTVSPNPRSLRVPAETTVLVVNKLRQRAELLVNGLDYGAVPASHQVGVTVHRGPVGIALVPACQLTGTAQPAVVEVTGAPAAPEPSAAAPTAAADPGASGAPGQVDVTRTRPVPRPRRASGLLVLVAWVLIAGVSIMAIRAKVAEGTSSMRTNGQTGLARGAGTP